MAITKIVTQTITSTTNRWDFVSIPSTFTDLMVVCSMRATNSAANVNFVIRINDDTSASYIQRDLTGNGSSASSGNSTSNTYLADPIIPGSLSTANTFGSSVYYFPNYSGSTQKSFSADGVSEHNGSLAYQQMLSMKWSGTAAINKFSFWAGDPANSGYGFAIGSTISIYGVTKGSLPGVTVS